MSRPIDPRLLRTVPACRRLLAVVTVLQVVGAGLVIAQATLLVRVIVAVFVHRVGFAVIGADLGWLVGVGAARALLAAGQEWVATRASLVVRADLRQATLAAIGRLGPVWARRQTAGRLVTATGPGVDGLDGYITRALPALVSAATVPALVLARVTWADWQSGLILLACLPLVPLFMALVGITTRRQMQRRYEILARLAGQFLDLLRGLTTLRVYGQAAAQERTLGNVTEAYRRHTLSTLRVAFLSGLVLDLLAALSVAVVAVDIGLRLDHGGVAFSTALLVLLLAPEVFAPLRAFGAQHHASQEGATAAAAALDIIDEAPAVASSAGGTPLLRGDARLVDATAGYPNRAQPALADVTISFPAGTLTALTGRSGAGKSTLLAALLGFVTPTSGAVVADLAGSPRSLAGLDLDAWRENVAWLPQRPRPTQPTVADEVRLGDPHATDAAVRAACRRCHAPDPATPLGEDGSAVSAGQRRRIALARALLRAESVRARGGMPLVLLDEPSEDLDRATESVIAAVLADFRGWATVVVATHSDRIVAGCDRVVSMRDGRVGPVRNQTPAHPRSAAPGPAPAAARAAVPPAVSRAEPYRLRDLVRDSGTGRRLAGAAGLAVLAAASGIGLTATSMWLISRAAQHPNLQALSIAVVGVRTFAIGRALLRYFERLATHDVALRILATMRVRVFAALRPLPHGALGAYGRGDLLRRFVGDVDGVQDGLVRAVVPAAGALATAAGTVLIATALAPGAGLILAGGVLLGGVVIPWLAYRGAGSAASFAHLAGRRDRRIANLLDGLDELVAYGRVDHGVSELAASERQLIRRSRRPNLAAAGGIAASEMLGALTLAGVLAEAAAAVRAGQLSVVNVGVVAVCVLIAFDALGALPAAFVAWARCRAGLARVAEVTARTAAFGDPLDAPELEPNGLALDARAVTVAPDPAAEAVVHDAVISLRRGTRVAITGSSGTGKTTLLAAVLRQLPIRHGSIVLRAHGRDADLRDIRAGDMPPLVAGSLQGDHVFDATLADNVRLGRPSADDAALDDVARKVGLLDLIHGLPAGWGTPAGPDGAALSGGQRQRLVLARALLADPAILVLDEPTAHLDVDTERHVMDELFDATAGRTVLLSTHRSLAADRVDTVVTLVDGRVVVPACAG